MTGAAFGAAVTGKRPVLEIMFGDFLALSMDSLINQATKYWFLTGERQSCPLVIRSVVGGGARFGAIHSQMPVSWLTGIPGLKIVAPSTPADAKGLLKAAIRDDNPVIFFEHKRLYSLSGPVGGDEPEPLGKATVVREGERRHAGQRDEGRARLPRGRRPVGRAGHVGRGDRPAHIAADRPRDDHALGPEDEPDRGRRRGAAHGRLGRRGARARHRGGPGRSRRRLAHHHPELADPYSPPLEDAFFPGPERIAAEIRGRLR